MKRNPCATMPLWKWILYLVVGFVVLLVLYSLASTPYYLIPKPIISSVTLIICALILVLAYMALVRLFEKEGCNDISCSRMVPDTAKGLLTGTVYFVATASLMALLGCYRITGFHLDLLHQISMLCMFLVVAVGEEIIFRGILFRLIDQRWNTAAALIVSSLLFGIIHISNDNATLFSSIAIALEAGLLLGAAYKVAGNLWLPIGIHWAWNYMQGCVLGFAVSGTETADSMFSADIHGPQILTGGEFGAEASIIALVLGVALSLVFIKQIYKQQKESKQLQEISSQTNPEIEDGTV